MAVYTQLSAQQLSLACTAFGLGALHEAHPIPQGSINTNFRIETKAGRYFLRHTTVRSQEDLAFEAALLDHLHAAAFPAPAMKKTVDGRAFIDLQGGRVSVFGWLPGEERTRPQMTLEAARAVGRELGKLHRICNAFEPDRANPYGPTLVRSWLDGLDGQADDELRAIASELRVALERSLPFGELVPRGVVHADLFMDNVKWIGDRVGAFFDFEMACRDALVLDLAITLNAWCFDGGYVPALCLGLVQGYEEQRPLQPSEHEALYRAAMYGAIRYTCSRIRDFHLSRLSADRLFMKDFRTYLARVRDLRVLGAEGFCNLVGLRRELPARSR